MLQKLREGWRGRSARQEFWVRFLILVMGNVVLSFLFGTIGLPPEIVSLLTLPVWLYIAARRLHDLGLTGWLGLIPFGFGFLSGFLSSIVPFEPEIQRWIATLSTTVPGLLMLVWLGFFRGQPDANRFGPPPGQESPAEVF